MMTSLRKYTPNSNANAIQTDVHFGHRGNNSRPQLRWSHSFSTDRQKPNVTLIRRKSAVERLAESKCNYIKQSNMGSNIAEKHTVIIQKSLQSTPAKASLIIVSPTQSSHQSLNSSLKCEPNIVLLSQPSVTSRKRNASLSSRLSEGSNHNLEIQLRQLIIDDSDSDANVGLKNSKNDVNVCDGKVKDVKHREPVLTVRRTYSNNNNNNNNINLCINANKSGNNANESKRLALSGASRTSSHSYYEQNPSAHTNTLTTANKQMSISRSKSDVSHRLANRRYKSKDEIERFFETLGLDSSVWDSIKSEATTSLASTPVHYFESCESFNSATHKLNMSSSSLSSSAHSNVTPNDKSGVKLNERLVSSRSCHTLSVGTSIVEKNARVIKWLYNCRKAMLQL